MTLRRYLLAGSGVALAAAAVVYAPLRSRQAFDRFVANRLGIEPAVAASLLEYARREHGEDEIDRRAWKFVVAVRRPLAHAVPASQRRSAVETFLGGLLDPPPARLAYVRGLELVACGTLE